MTCTTFLVGFSLGGTSSLIEIYNNKWDKVFKSGTSKICGRQSLKILKDMVCLNRPYPFKFFRGCFLQILLVPLLNTWTQVILQLLLIFLVFRYCRNIRNIASLRATVRCTNFPNVEIPSVQRTLGHLTKFLKKISWYTLEKLRFRVISIRHVRSKRNIDKVMIKKQ